MKQARTQKDTFTTVQKKWGKVAFAKRNDWIDLKKAL